MSKRFLSCARLFILSMFLFLPSVLHAEIFFQDGFESGNLNGWALAYDDNGCNVEKWDTNNPRIVITTDDKASGTYAAKYNDHIGDDCIYMHKGFTAVGSGRDIYYRFKIKFSSNYEWYSWSKTAEIRGTRTGARIIFSLNNDRQEDATVPIPSSRHQAIPMIGVYPHKTVYGDAWQPCNNSQGTNFCQNIDMANPFYITAGQWYTVEIYIRPDAGNGIVKLWINGKQIMEHSSLYTISDSTQTFYTVEPGGTFNQEPANGIVVESSHYFDDIIVSDTCNSCDQPSAQIINPTNSGTYTTTNTTINLSGTATDTLGTNIGITSVTWSNDRGGSGTASGTTNWSISNVPLQSGQNIITVTATDGDGKTATDVLVVTVTTSGGGDTGGNTGGSGGDSTSSGNSDLSANSTGGDTEISGGGCGFVKDSNGKGPTFAIMLIIILTGISIIRKMAKRI
ncbi:MAG: heparin lyase I family protein [Nitrospirae bacterium]|nr:heparin lyase I family protein [Nitrospirota bacterium]